MSDEHRQSVNLLDFLAFIVRWRKALILSVLIVTAVVTVLVFILPERFQSRAVIRANDSTGQSIGSLISSKLGALSGIGGLAPGLVDEAGRYLLLMLRGRELNSRVIEKFNLREVYDIPAEKPIEDVLETLADNTLFQRDVEANAIMLEVDDEEPARAHDMAEFYISELDRINREITAHVAREEREFIGNRLAEARNDLAVLEDSMTVFQLKTGVLSIEDQIKATVEAGAQLEAMRLITQAELEMKRQIFDQGSSEIEMLKLKLAGIDSSLSTIIRHRDADAAPDFLVNLLDSPELAKVYLRLMREIEVQSLVVLYLTQQYEQNRIEAIRNTPTISVIEPPAMPTRRIWPKRGVMVVLAAIGSFVFASTVCLLIDFFRRAAADPSHPQHESLARLREAARKED